MVPYHWYFGALLLADDMLGHQHTDGGVKKIRGRTFPVNFV